MLYLLFGKQDLMVKNHLKKLVKERLPQLDDFNYVRYNGRETPVHIIVDECASLPMGYERKVVVIEDAYFLSTFKTKEKIEKDQDYAKLLRYLGQPNEQTDLIFTLSEPTFNSKTDIGKILNRDAMKSELTDIDDKTWPEYVRRYFAKRDVRIDNNAIGELVSRCQNDATQFVQEASKLMLVGDHVTLEDVKALVSRPLEENTFALSNALTNGRLDEALAIFRDLRAYSEEPVTLINLLAKQFRLMLKIYYLSEQGKSLDQISRELGVHEYRVKLALNRKRTFTDKRLIEILERLYQLDYQIKSGLVDRFYGFELFIVNFNETSFL